MVSAKSDVRSKSGQTSAIFHQPSQTLGFTSEPSPDLRNRTLILTPLDEDVSCLDIDKVVRVSIGDRDVRKYLQERYGIADSIKVQELEKEKRNEIILSCLEIGTGLRQLSRLTGVTYGVINKLNKGR